MTPCQPSFFEIRLDKSAAKTSPIQGLVFEMLFSPPIKSSTLTKIHINGQIYKISTIAAPIRLLFLGFAGLFPPRADWAERRRYIESVWQQRSCMLGAPFFCPSLFESCQILLLHQGSARLQAAAGTSRIRKKRRPHLRCRFCCLFSCV